MAHDRIGPFAILAELATWESGAVYKAADLKGRTVALRTMRLDAPAAQENAEAFRAAARAASALDSPNIASVLGGGEAAGVFFVALEFVEGSKLSATLDKGEPMTLSEVTDLSRQVGSGLDHAHSKGVIHPELRPGNIVLEWDGTAKLMDFGFPRRHTGSELTEALFYISPEEARGEPLTPRSNLFTWGAILYQMVTGKRPFGGETAEEVRRRIIAETPPAPHEVSKDVHPNVSYIVMKALSKAPAERYASGTELVRDLENYRQLQVALPKPAEPAPKPVAAPPTAEPRPKPAPAAAPPAPAEPLASPAAAKAQAPAAPVSPAAPKPEAPPKPQATAPPAAAPAAPTPPAAAAKAERPASAPKAEPKAAAPKAAAPQAVAPKPAAAAKPAAPQAGPSNRLIYVMGGAVGVLVIVAVVAAVLLQRPSPQQDAAAPAPATAALEKPVPATPVPESAPATPESRATGKAKAKQPPPAPAAPVIVPGEISIDSTPSGADIFIDGKHEAAWVTPHSASLNPGQHTVTLNKAGHISVTRTIEVTAGQKATVAVGLTELAATLSVSSDPTGAAILLDGKDTGKVTPAQLIVAKGSHAVTVRKQGYLEASNTMELAPGQSAQFAPTLKLTGSTENIKTAGRFGKLFGGAPENSGRVTVRTNPKGAQVTVNGQALGKTTPVDFFLNPGTYEIVLTREGYQPVKKLITVEKGGKLVVDETLAK